MKIKNICSTEDSIRKSTNWKKIFSNYLFNKGLVSRTHKKCSKLRRKIKSTTRNWAKDEKSHIQRGYVENRFKKRRQMST